MVIGSITMMGGSLPLPLRTVLPAPERAITRQKQPPSPDRQSRSSHHKVSCVLERRACALHSSSCLLLFLEKRSQRRRDSETQWASTGKPFQSGKKKEVCHRKITAINYRPSALPPPHTPHRITALEVPDVSKTLSNSRL